MGTISELYHPEGKGAKYKAVIAAIRDAISNGTLNAGDKLPPVRDLAWDLKITPGTVARAYTALTDEGVLTAAVGRGTFVATSDTRKHGVFDQRWDWPVAEDDAPLVNLFSPKLPDVGQVALIREAMARVAQRRPGIC